MTNLIMFKNKIINNFIYYRFWDYLFKFLNKIANKIEN
jgi:hypothetical protein